MAIAEVKGLTWPLTIGPLGHLNRASGVGKVRSNLEAIARTRLRERLFAVRFGTLGFSAVFRNLDQATFTLLEHSANVGFAENEPNAVIRSTKASASLEDEGQIDLRVAFTLVGSDDEQIIVVTV